MNRRPDDEPLRTLLIAFVRRARWQTLTRRTIASAAILGVGLSLFCSLDGLWPQPTLIRELYFDFCVGFAVSRVIPAAARLMTKEVDFVRAAERLEACAPWFQQRLSTLMSQPDNASTLANQLLAATLADLKQRPRLFSECTPWKPILRRLFTASALMGAALLVAHFVGGPVSRTLPPWPPAGAADESVFR